MTDSFIYINHQIECLLQKLSDEEYSQSLQILDGATMGKHVRHIIEFYQILISSKDVIDYSARIREQEIETSINAAIQALQQIANSISILNFDENRTVIFDASSSKHAYQTTIGRELMYGFDHAIHHLAIMKIGAQSLNKELPNHFGVAPSTLVYRQSSL